MIRRKYIVSGKVQGVWFRARAQEEAKNLQLTGFAKNEEDGTVSVEVQGPEENISWIEDWLQLGPPMARVESVKGEDIEIIKEEEEFSIL